MQAYAGQPVIEAQQDRHVDAALMQLQEDLQQHLQQEQHYSCAMPPAADDAPHGAGRYGGAADACDSLSSSPPSELYDAAAAAVAAAAAASSRPGSVGSARSAGGEEEWHLVSPTGSVKAPSSSSRASFDDAAAAVDADGSGSDSDTVAHSPKDELAASILGQSMMAAAAAAAITPEHSSQLESYLSSSDDLDTAQAAAAAATLDSVGACGAATAVAAAGASCSSSGSAAADCVAAAPLQGDEGLQLSAFTGATGPGAVDGSDEVLTGWGVLSGQLAGVVGAAQGRAAVSFEGLREWLMESLAALVETGRSSHAACISGAQSTLRSLQLAAKQGSLAAAAVNAAADWKLLLSSAAAVVCLALWMKSRKEAAVLRLMLRRRDHELSKLVMRLVSLQELINQGHHLPIARYGSVGYNSSGLGAAASLM